MPGSADGVAARIRARWGKTDKIRFVSAIDLERLWERALRKADLPIAYSEGFSPHPKVSFPDALPLGYASTGEYVELTFAAPVAIDAAMASLNAAFPTGLAVHHAVGVADGAPKLAKSLQASLWHVDYRLEDVAAMRDAVAALLAADELLVERQRKGAPVQIDLRPAISQISTTSEHPGVRVSAVLHQVEPPVRPSEVHLALADTFRSDTAGPLPEPALITRVAQGIPTDEGVTEALTGALIALEPPALTP